MRVGMGFDVHGLEAGTELLSWGIMLPEAQKEQLDIPMLMC